MTSYPIGMFVIASLALGQDGGAKRPEAPETTKPPAASTPAVVHKLDTVVWNPAAKELSWVVSVWDLSGAVEKPLAKQTYSVKLDNATMKSNGETRSFDTEEARQVRLVMDMISAYAVGSTVWWERGLGDKEECPVPDKNKDVKPTPSTRPTTVALPGRVAVTLPAPQAAVPVH
jgi:hypothetical protein